MKSIREFAQKINQSEERLDILIHNAGFSTYFKGSVTEDGIETTMATNHYGPFLLTHLLIDLMKKTTKINPCRIVVVASKTHTLSFMNPLDEYHLNPVGYYPSANLYANSKFSNFLFTYECARRLEQGTKITVNCLHPGKITLIFSGKCTTHKYTYLIGVVDTNIFRNIPIPFKYVFDIGRKLFLKNLQEGIQTVLYVALSEDLNGVTGKYYRDCREGTPREDVYNRDWQTALWNASKKIVKLTEDDPKI